MISSQKLRPQRALRPRIRSLDGRLLLSGALAAGARELSIAPQITRRVIEDRTALDPAPIENTTPLTAAAGSHPGTGTANASAAPAILRRAPRSRDRAHPAGPLIHSSRAPGPHNAAIPVTRPSTRATKPAPLPSIALAPRPGPIGPSEVPYVALATPENAPLVTQAIVDLTNYLRSENHLPPLVQDSRLSGAAQIHSQDMALLNTMAHTLPGTAAPGLTDRASIVHYRYTTLGENIAYNQADASSVVASWMASPPHRQNMLGSSFTDIGVGLAWNSRGEPYYTMMLGKPA